MEKRTYAIISAALALIVIGGILVFTTDTASSPSSVPNVISEDKLASADSYSQGPTGAPVRIVEFSDFECPACGAMYPVLKKVLPAYEGKVRFTYRNFPLTQHKHSRSAAEAAEAAGLQGKFWEMHDKIFENQSAMEDKDLEKYASELGLNMDKFRSDWRSDAVKQKVERDVKTATQLNVNSTPTFYINGMQLAGGISEPGLRAEIEKRIK